jgi:hypothetical protein
MSVAEYQKGETIMLKVISYVVLSGMILFWIYSIVKVLKWKTLQGLEKIIWSLILIFGLISISVFTFLIAQKG